MVSRSRSCLPATKPVEGGHGSVMTVASRPFSRKQARPYQVISMGGPILPETHERRCPPNDTGARRREGGGGNPVRISNSQREPYRPRVNPKGWLGLRNLNLSRATSTAAQISRAAR